MGMTLRVGFRAHQKEQEMAMEVRPSLGLNSADSPEVRVFLGRAGRGGAGATGRRGVRTSTLRSCRCESGKCVTHASMHV